MKAFTLRIRKEEDAAALRELERFTGSRTRSKAVWEAIRRYAIECRAHARLAEESHATQRRYLDLLEALDLARNARETLDREISAGMKIRGHLALKNRIQSEAMASATIAEGGYESIDDLPSESGESETQSRERRRAWRPGARRGGSRARRSTGE